MGFTPDKGQTPRKATPGFRPMAIPTINAAGANMVNLPEAARVQEQQERIRRESAIKQKQAEYDLQRTQAPPQKLSAKDLTEMSDIPDMYNAIKLAGDTIQAVPSAQRGPLLGRVSNVNPYATEAKQAESLVRAESQRFGRYMEGGVLRKEDEEKYFKIYPQLTDIPAVVKYKVAILQRMLAQKHNLNIKTYEAQNFDITGLKELKVPELPKLGKVYDNQVQQINNAASGILEKTATPVPVNKPTGNVIRLD